MKDVAPSINVSLPRDLRKRLTDKVGRLGSYSSTSEYIRELIRDDLRRDEFDEIERKLTEGLDSEFIKVDKGWWNERRAALRKKR